MSFQDPISDCLNRIRNGLMRGKDSVIVPYSKIKHDLVNVLIEEGYLNSWKRLITAARMRLVSTSNTLMENLLLKI